jgi:hypothetical protein
MQRNLDVASFRKAGCPLGLRFLIALCISIVMSCK